MTIDTLDNEQTIRNDIVRLAGLYYEATKNGFLNTAQMCSVILRARVQDLEALLERTGNALPWMKTVKERQS